jgi:flavin-dependent dehydrogenase
MTRTTTDVVIVGAGPAGSATALLLARRDYRVVIVDRARFPRSKPCGEYLNPGAVAILDRLGLVPAVRAAGSSLSGMYVAGADGTTVWAPFPAGQGLLITRDRLDHALLLEAACAGAQVIEGYRVDAVTPGPAPSVAGRRGSRSLRLAARLVVGADGLRSVVARRAGPLEMAAHAHYTVGAHFAGLQVSGPRGDLHLGRGFYAGAAHHGGGIGNVVVALPRAAFVRAGGDAEAAFAQACAALPALRAIMRGARRISKFASVGPLGYTHRQATGDGILLVGDAAATINPMTGEGIYLALHGAELAAAAADLALRGGRATRAALDGYERARTAAFRGIWTASRVLQWIIRHPRLVDPLFHRVARRPDLASALLGLVSDRHCTAA